MNSRITDLKRHAEKTGLSCWEDSCSWGTCQREIVSDATSSDLHSQWGLCCRHNRRGASTDRSLARANWHANFQTLQGLLRHGSVEGFCLEGKEQVPESCLCEACSFGKQARLPLFRNTQRAGECGELVHFNVRGLMRVKYSGECRWLAVFRGYLMVYPIRAMTTSTLQCKTYWSRLLRLVISLTCQGATTRQNSSLRKSTKEPGEATVFGSERKGSKPSVKHLWILGSVGYTHVEGG